MMSTKTLGRSFLNTWILLILLLSPLLVQALDDDALAKGGRGGGGGSGRSRSGSGKSVKMIKLFGKLNVALWVVIVVAVVVGLLALCCLFCIFSWCCGRGKKNNKNRGLKTLNTAEAGHYHKMQDQPFLPVPNAPYNPEVYHPPSTPYQGGGYEKPGEAAQYYNQPYGQGGFGYANNDKMHAHDASVSSMGSQPHSVPYPPWGAAGQR